MSKTSNGDTQIRDVRQPGEPRCDAFTSWTFATGFRDSIAPGSPGDEPQVLWLMLRLRGLAEGESPTRELHQRAQQLPPGWLMLPRQYAQSLRGLVEARHCTALASPAFVKYLVGKSLVHGIDAALEAQLDPIRRSIEAFEIGLQAADWDACTEKPGPLIAKTEDRPSSVIGIIDDGLPFAHHRFSWRDHGIRRTRFLALWDQSDRPAGRSRGSIDCRWCIGRTVNSTEMDAAIRAGTRHGHVDDDAVYHHAGTAPLLRHRVTHGAHVLDLACGAEPPESQTSLPAIIGVQLRPMNSTLCLSPGAHLFDAIRFIIAQADAACGVDDQVDPCPITINASVGNIAGPHDGHSIFEEAVDELLDQRRHAFPKVPINLVLPAGNSNLSRCHAWSQMEPDSRLALDWHLHPDDGTSSYLEIWLRPLDFDADHFSNMAIEVQLTSPGSKNPLVVTASQTGGVTAGSAEAPMFDDEGRIIAIVGLHPQPANGRYWMALVTVAPTAPYGPWHYTAPAGAWKVAITAHSDSSPVYCNVYSQRDDRSFGHKGWGRQAVLEDNYDRKFDDRTFLKLRDGSSFRRRVGTVNGMATGSKVLVAGGLVVKPGSDWQPARYSSAAIPVTTEPTSAGNRVFAFTEDSPVLHGLHAAGTRSGTTASVSGTSMAAPQVARALAAGLGVSPALVDDYDAVVRPVIWPAADLDRRSKRRRGDS